MRIVTELTRPRVVVRYAGATSQPAELEVELNPKAVWSFGRSRGDLQLNPDDHGVSRDAGTIRFQGGLWVLKNESRKRAFAVECEGFPRRTVGPGGREVIQRSASLVVSGDVYTYEIRIDVSGSVEESERAHTTTTPTTFVPSLSLKEQRAVAAMGWGYLQRGRNRNPQPLTYREAGALLGVSEDSVRKRVERLRDRLVSCGVAGLIDQRDARRELVEFCLTHDLIDGQIVEHVRRLGS
jgi:hypothetical protein